MKNILFVTGNNRKIKEAQSSCDLFEIKVLSQPLDIDEIQDHDPIKITKRKAEDAFS